MEKRKFVPKVFNDEMKRLAGIYFHQVTDEEYESDDNDSIMKGLLPWMMEHASPLLKLYLEYDSFCGDEGQLLDRDGSAMRDEDGFWVQEWIVDENGFCFDRTTKKQLFYSDGTPVIQRGMPPELKSYFE